MNKNCRKNGETTSGKSPLEVAFTLIELLVVIAIIAILAGMLLPSLANAKNKAIQVIDRNNYKQLCYATQMYAHDNKDNLPAPGWGEGDSCWAYAKNMPVNGGGSPLAIANMYSNQINYLKKGELWPYCKNQKVWVCPLDKSNALWNQRAVLISSYVMNGSVCNFGGLTGGKTYKMTQYRADSLQFWETDETTPFFFNDASSYPDEGISQRHVKGATVAAFGSTAVSISFKDFYSNKWAGTQGSRGQNIPKSMLPNLIWNSPGDRYGL